MSFDDGPYPYGAEIASFFEQHGSLASFFVSLASLPPTAQAATKSSPVILTE